MKLTIDEIKAYLATKGPDDVVGQTLAARHCLTASCLLWLHPDSAPVVEYHNRGAWLNSGDEVEFDQDVRDAADKFDRLPIRVLSPVTRSQLEDWMPELFTKDVQV